MDFATTLILVILGILLEAFFSGSEIGMVSVNRIKMKHLVDWVEYFSLDMLK